MCYKKLFRRETMFKKICITMLLFTMITPNFTYGSHLIQKEFEYDYFITALKENSDNSKDVYYLNSDLDFFDNQKKQLNELYYYRNFSNEKLYKIELEDGYYIINEEGEKINDLPLDKEYSIQVFPRHYVLKSGSMNVEISIMNQKGEIINEKPLSFAELSAFLKEEYGDFYLDYNIQRVYYRHVFKNVGDESYYAITDNEGKQITDYVYTDVKDPFCLASPYSSVGNYLMCTYENEFGILHQKDMSFHPIKTPKDVDLIWADSSFSDDGYIAFSTGPDFTYDG